MHRRPVDTGKLWAHIDRLTRDRKQRLVRQTYGRKPWVEYVEIPSLWTQLVEDVASSSSGGGHAAGGAGSRAPLNIGKVALMDEISTEVREALKPAGVRPRYLADPQYRSEATLRPRPELGRHDDDERTPWLDPGHAGRLVEWAARAVADRAGHRDIGRAEHDTSADLRQLATLVVGTDDQALVDAWVDRIGTWTARIQTELADDESIDLRGVRGHACPACLTVWMLRDLDGEYVRDPALVVAFREGQVRTISCRACQTSWWRGEDINTLTDQLAANQRTHGDPRTWGYTVTPNTVDG